jgi:hypothetical protein
MTAQEKQCRREPAYSRRVVVDLRGLASSCLCVCSCGARTAQSRQAVQDETCFARSFAMLFSPSVLSRGNTSPSFRASLRAPTRCQIPPSDPLAVFCSTLAAHTACWRPTSEPRRCFSLTFRTLFSDWTTTIGLSGLCLRGATLSALP